MIQGFPSSTPLLPLQMICFKYTSEQASCQEEEKTNASSNNYQAGWPGGTRGTGRRDAGADRGPGTGTGASVGGQSSRFVAAGWGRSCTSRITSVYSRVRICG